MKEQLVEMTGLSPRVIRVWFQNKRCKDKKKTIQMKLQMQQEKVWFSKLHTSIYAHSICFRSIRPNADCFVIDLDFVPKLIQVF